MNRHPRVLREGDTVALVAMSSPPRCPEDVAAAAALLESWGLRVRGGRSLDETRDYLAGDAASRAEDLRACLADPDVAAVFFIRGGYGAAQLLPHLGHPLGFRKDCTLAGYSDLTTLLNAVSAESGVAWHLPTGAALADAARTTAPAREAARVALFGGLARGYSVQQLSGGFAATRLRPGSARGRIIGGNLTVFTTLIGTPWLPPPEGSILLLEDINEAPYRLDRMVTHLANCGYLGRLAGIVLGSFTDCRAVGDNRWTALEGVAEALRNHAVPVLAGLPVGHDPASFPIPIGATGIIDGDDLLITPDGEE